MSIEAIKKALEALEQMQSALTRCMGSHKAEEGDRHRALAQGRTAITTLRAAINQMEKQDGDCQQCGGQGCVACDARKQEQFGPQEILQMIVDRALEKPAAPVQEPVAWIFKPHRELLWPNEVERKNPLELNEYTPLYTTPPAQPAPVPDLTHDQWDEWQDKHGLILEREALDELRSMIYTAAAQPEPVQQERGEPVAWMDASGDIYKHELWPDWNPPHTPLYIISPAQPEPASWMEMVVANLVREGVNKHKARELAQHFYGLAQPAPVQEPVAGKGKELSEQLKLCARNVAFVAAGRVDMSSAAMQEMFALIDHVCVGLDSPSAQPEPMKGKS